MSPGIYASVVLEDAVRGLSPSFHFSDRGGPQGARIRAAHVPVVVGDFSWAWGAAMLAIGALMVRAARQTARVERTWRFRVSWLQD